MVVGVRGLFFSDIPQWHEAIIRKLADNYTYRGTSALSRFILSALCFMHPHYALFMLCVFMFRVIYLAYSE